MKQYFFLTAAIVFLVSSSSAQFPGGLGFEIGGGYNQIFWDVKNSDLSGDRTEFSLTPMARVSYLLMLSETFDLVPFAGYNRFGGKSATSTNGYRDAYWFDAIEMGLSGQQHFDNFRIGIGVKANWHIDATAKTFEESGEEHEVDLIKEWKFPEWSADVGARVGYVFEPWSVAGEAWFGVTNLLKGTFFEQYADARENHYRILVGYTIP